MKPRTKSKLFVIACLAAIALAVQAKAQVTPVFGSRDYIRGTKAPKMISDSFTATAGTEYKLEVYNGGIEDASTERISASVIYLNGDLVVGTSDFNQNVAYIEKPVTLQADNMLKVQVRSKPGGKITVQIVSTASDTTPPVVAITSPADGSTLDSNTPFVIIDYSDSGSGVDSGSFQASINGTDHTPSFTVSATQATYQLTETLPEGVNQISATISDISGNTASATAGFTVSTSNEPPVTEASGFIHGMVYDAATDLPLAEAKVTARNVTGEVLADNEGKFVFPVPDTGLFYLSFNKAGYTSVFRQAEVITGRDTAVEPAHLTPIDGKTTVITPAGGIVTDSTGTIELNVPSNAINEAVAVRITAMEKLEDIPGLQPDFLLFVFCGKFEPDGLIFNSPVPVRVYNSSGFEPGLELPLTHWDETTYAWDEAGTATVSADGQWVEFSITHFSYYHINFKTGCPGNATNCPPLCPGGCPPPPPCPGAPPLSGWPDINFGTMASNLFFSYNPAYIGASVLIDGYIESYLGYTSGTIAPTREVWKMQMEGFQQEVVFTGSRGETYFNFMWDGVNARGEKVPTGSYPFKIEVSHVYEPGMFDYAGKETYIPVDVTYSSAFEGRVPVLNEPDNPFGGGWRLKGLHRLHFDPDGYILLTDGQGTKTFSPVEGSTVYSSPKGDFSTLQQNADGSFTRTTKEGTAYEFSSTGRLTSKADRNGNTTQYTYDQANRLTAITDPYGRITSFSYNGSGYLQSITDFAGRVIQCNVDTNNNLTSITTPDGAITAYTYTANHRLISITGPRGYTTQYQYDAYSRISQATYPDGRIKTYQPATTQNLVNDLPPGAGTLDNPAPSVTGRYASYTDGNGNTTTYKVDQWGAIIEETDALGNTTYYERNCACGAPTKITYPNGRVVSMTYDDKGNLLIQTEEATGAITAYTYEPSFNQVTGITDPVGNVTQISYDANGNLIQATDALGNITGISYNTRGQLTHITNALYETTVFSYDPATGNLLSTTDPLGNTTTYTYDAADNILSATDAEGRTTSYTYDTMNRLLSVTDADNSSTSYEYDAAGNLITVTDAKGQVTQFAYNEENQPSSTTNPLGYTKTYAYDANGNLLSNTDAENQTIDYTYDALNRLIQKTLPDSSSVNYSYDVAGNLLKVYAPHSLTFMEYDLLSRLKSSTPLVNTRDDEYANYVSLPANTVINSNDTSFDNTDILVVDGAVVTINGTHTFKNVAVINGGKLTHSAGSRLDITADTIVVDSSSSIDAAGRGYAGGYTLGNTTNGASTQMNGGSHGGVGGNTYLSGSAVNEVYGDYRNPYELGSGGGPVGDGDAGGGSLRITANSIVLNGIIAVNGNNGWLGGGGSGGSVRLDVDDLSGTGVISANGGQGLSGWHSHPAGGGGGRIAVYYGNMSGYTGDISAYGRPGAAGDGSAGTIYLKNSTQIHGDLIVDNNNLNIPDYGTPLRSIGSGYSNSIIYSPTTGISILTDIDAAWPEPDPATGALGLIGLILSPNTNQAEPRVTFEVLDNTATTITVDGDMTQMAASGDPYIGEYTFDNLYLRGKARVNTEDEIYVLGAIEINGAKLKAHALKFSDSSQLQAANAAIEVTEPLFGGHSTVTLDGGSFTINSIDVMDTLQLTNAASVTVGNITGVKNLWLADNSHLSVSTLSSLDSIQLTNGSVLKGFALTPLDITVGSLTIDSLSSINVSGRGYAPGYTLGNTTDGASLYGAGGSYGGQGGVYTGNSVSNQAYGDYRDPNEFGSGSSYYGDTGAYGGGLVRIVANSFTLDGVINANGNTSTYGGGGSGGGIRLDVGTLSGTGSINTLGGNGGNRGGGGGGRIAIYYTDKSGFSGSINAYGGTGYSSGYLGYGGAGTVYLKSAAQEHGDLTANNNGRNTSGYTTPLRAIGTGYSDSIVYSPSTNWSTLTDTTAAWPVPDSISGALGLIGLELNPNTIQSQSYTIVDNAVTTLTVEGDITQAAQAGDAYIGEYTFDNLYAKGKAKLSTEDDIYVLNAIEVNNSVLNAHALKFLSSDQLQATNGVIKLTEPLFNGFSNVTLDGDTLTVENIGGMDSLQLTNGAALRSFYQQPLEIITGSLTVDASSSIDVNGRGYAPGYTLGNTTDGASLYGAGGSYGGQGGVYTGNSVSNQAYGDYRDPNEFGSGSSYYGNTGAYGGGLVRIVANSFTLDGIINANGNTSTYGGGGSGGGIRLDVGTLSGTGSINTLGGSGGSRGGGGGGRIAIYYTDKSGFSGSINAYGGTGYSSGYLGYGGAGTVYLKSAAQEHGDLTANNNGRNTSGYTTPLRAIGTGYSDSIVYSPSTNWSTLTDTTAAWPVPDAATGALGLIGLALNPNTAQSQTYTVVDNTAGTITIDGNITSVTTSGDAYIGEYRFDNLSVTNGTQVSTEDDIYFNSLDTTGGILNAHNVYQAGMADRAIMLAQEYAGDMEISGADQPAVAKLARQINRWRGQAHSLSPPKITVASPEKKATSCVYSSGFGPDDILTILKTGVSPLDAADKQIEVVQAEEIGASPLYYVQEKKAPRAPVLLAQAAGVDPQYTYDLNGNRITMTDPTGTTYYEYDSLSRLTKITNPNSEITTYTYDALGRRTGMTYPNSMTTGYSYDGAGRLLDLVYQLNSANTATFNYTYDKVGNRTSMTDEYGLHDYTYDALYRLLQAAHPQPANPLEQFGYDTLGNRLDDSVYNEVNQLLEDADFIYSYDRNGNTITKASKADTSGVHYYWNAENQLIKIEEYSNIGSNVLLSKSEYIYDGMGRRVVKNVDGLVTKYVYDQLDILLETDVSDAVKARYTHGLGVDEPISMERDGQSYYYVADGLGSIVKLLDAAGNVVNNYVYDSFGNMVERTESVANPYTYTAREYDAESGLYYYRLRYYDASIGRFLSEDPLMSDPNAYAYVGNNPLNYVDPMGLEECGLFDSFVNNYMDRETWECEKRCWDKLNLGVGKYLLTAIMTLGGIAETGVGIEGFNVMFGNKILSTYYLENFQIFMLRMAGWVDKITIPAIARFYNPFPFLARHGKFIVGKSESIFFRESTTAVAGWTSGTLIGCSISCSMNSNNW